MKNERVLHLQAGMLSATWNDGELRDIRWQDALVLQSVYAAVRSPLWQTIPGETEAVAAEDCGDTCRLTFAVKHRTADVDFSWQGSVVMRGEGVVEFGFVGKALRRFEKARIGICLLHSAAACAGKSLRIRRPDGCEENIRFPLQVSRAQPLAGTEAIGQMEYETEPGLVLRISLAGDVFQMEDQRPWTDASFKTFCTPLEQPCPAWVEPGEEIRQSARLDVIRCGYTAQSGSIPTGAHRVEVASGTREIDFGKWPAIGFGLAVEKMNAVTHDRLRILKPAHLRVELRLFESGWQEHWLQAQRVASGVGCRLSLALLVSDQFEAELDALFEQAGCDPRVQSVLMVDRAGETSSLAVFETAARLWSVRPDVNLGYGTLLNFMQLRRLQSVTTAAQFVSFCLQPQEHAFDDESVLSTLPIQGQLLRQAQEEFGLPVEAGWIILRPRPVDALAVEAPLADRRQKILFGAAWAAGSLMQLCRHGALRASYFETCGDAGLMAPSGEVYPMYHIFADWAELGAGEALPVDHAQDDGVDCLAVRVGLYTELLLVNLRSRDANILLKAETALAWIRVLDERSERDAMTRPEAYRKDAWEQMHAGQGEFLFQLGSYATARVRWKSE